MARKKQPELPFDKREYENRMLAVERMKTDVLTRGQLKKVRFFIKFVFKHNKSSCEGDMTFVRCNSPKRAPFSLADEIEVSQSTLENYISWSKKIGVIEVSIDCDSYGDRRTTISFNWPQIKRLGGHDPPNQTPTVADQTPTVADQVPTVADQTPTVGTPYTPIHQITKVSQYAEVKGGDVGLLKRRLAELKVKSFSCIELAMRDGATVAEIEQVLSSALGRADAPPPGIVWGRIRHLGRKPQLARAPWPDEVREVQRLRRADTEHYRSKRYRAEQIRVSGETEATDALSDILSDSPELGHLANLQQQELESRFGDILDRMNERELESLAGRHLNQIQLRGFREFPEEYRLELLEAIRDEREL